MPKGIKYGGRRKGSLNKPNAEIRDILLENKEKLITKAVELAEKGNAVILSKLLDKLIPTLNYNHNINSSAEENIIKYLEEKKENLRLVQVNKESA